MWDTRPCFLRALFTPFTPADIYPPSLPRLWYLRHNAAYSPASDAWLRNARAKRGVIKEWGEHPLCWAIPGILPIYPTGLCVPHVMPTDENAHSIERLDDLFHCFVWKLKPVTNEQEVKNHHVVLDMCPFRFSNKPNY